MLLRNSIVCGEKEAQITIAELAELSNRVYYDKQVYDYLDLPPNWAKFADSEESPTGYRGACYLKNFGSQNGPYAIVFAHRGTVIHEPGSLLDFLNVALEKIPGQVSAASRFIINTGIELANHFSDMDWTNISTIQTGHSLGAVLADLSSLAGISLIPSITFENPGSKQIMISYLRSKHISEESIVTLLANLKKISKSYQASVSLINTCNEQVGTTWQLTNLPYDYGTGLNGPMLPISSNYFANPYYLYYTFRQHQITNIIEYLKTDGTVNEVQYPVGFQQGYIAYLDPVRKDYWDGYLQNLWSTHAHIREKFRDIKSFSEDFYKQLNQTQQEARGFFLGISTKNIHKNLLARQMPANEVENSLYDFVILDAPKQLEPKPVSVRFNEVGLTQLFSLFNRQEPVSKIEDDFVLVDQVEPSEEKERIEPQRKCTIS